MLECLSLNTVVTPYVVPFSNLNVLETTPFFQVIVVGGRPVVGEFRVSGDSETRPTWSNRGAKASV